ncbi:MAG: hypothetical protein V3T24_12530 [Longimicrobiales bacterium]
MRRVQPPSRDARKRLSALAERHLTADEVREALATPLSDSERDDSLSLIRWFRRRYPTPGERLAYARRAYRRWSAVQGQ